MLLFEEKHVFLYLLTKLSVQELFQGATTGSFYSLLLIAVLLLLHDDSAVLHLLLKLNAAQRLFSAVTREREVVLKLKSECMLLLQGLRG